jgi:uncharacterized membrane protein YraQ (UPF0718 family)
MHHDFWGQLGEALLMAAGMFWDVAWSLVLGFTISAVIQAVVSTEQMRRALGRDGVREIALATIAGAASSSCSYASAAISRTLFKKGAALIPSLAFLFASTNLVIELGIILYLLMGWQFTAAEWIGGVVLIVIMSVLVRLTYPAKLVEEARRHPEAASGHEHEAMSLEGETLWHKLIHARAHIVIAQNFATDWSMLWKDLAGGFLIAGALSAFAAGVLGGAVPQRNLALAAGAAQRAARPAGRGHLFRLLDWQCADGSRAVGLRHQLRRGAVIPLRRSHRLAAARCLPPLLWLAHGGLYRGRLLHHHGTGGPHHGCRLYRRGRGARAQPEYPRRADDVQFQLHLLAQPRFRRARGLFRLA